MTEYPTFVQRLSKPKFSRFERAAWLIGATAAVLTVIDQIYPFL